MIESEKFVKYMDISEVFLVLLNTDETILYANKYAAKLLGYKKEELVGMNWIDNFIPERNREEIRNDFIQRMKKKEEESFRPIKLVPIDLYTRVPHLTINGVTYMLIRRD